MREGEIGRAVAALCVAVCCAALAGCSAKADSGTVTGNVTLDGQPVKSGTIRFVPADGRTASGEAIITDGKYAVTMPPGDKRVSISSSKVVGKRKSYDTPDSPTVDTVQEVLPVKYNSQSELTLSVQAGRQPHDFELKSGK